MCISVYIIVNYSYFILVGIMRFYDDYRREISQIATIKDYN